MLVPAHQIPWRYILEHLNLNAISCLSELGRCMPKYVLDGKESNANRRSYDSVPIRRSL
jgi:hypothetical protein